MLEIGAYYPLIRFVVVHNQHVFSYKNAGCTTCPFYAASVCAQLGREIEGAAFAYGAFNADGTPHHFSQLLRNSQPKSGSTKAARGGGIRLGESLEQTVPGTLGNADAGVLNFKAQRDQALLIEGFTDSKDNFAPFREFYCVVEQVQKNLAQAPGVSE